MRCTSHDCRVEAYSGHDEEYLLLIAIVDQHPTDVDRAVIAG